MMVARGVRGQEVGRYRKGTQWEAWAAGFLRFLVSTLDIGLEPWVSQSGSQAFHERGQMQ